MMSLKKSPESETEKYMSPEEQCAKINEVRKMLGSVANKLPELSSDASVLRYLRARNWNATKASKMLTQTLKWRLEYRPDKIRWEDVAHEAETGKIYGANYLDKLGRTVLIMRPGYQNTKAVTGQIRFLVYCMENAIMNLGPDQEQMVWLIDFNRWTSTSTSLKATRETAHILQNHFPERLGLGIIYNPPKIFESFWKLVKPFIEAKTFKKVRFVYSNNPQSQKIMEETFDLDKLEAAFGGRDTAGFDYEAYARRMRDDDRRIYHPTEPETPNPEPLASEIDLSDEGESSSASEESSSSPDIVDDIVVDGSNGVDGIEHTAREIQIGQA